MQEGECYTSFSKEIWNEFKADQRPGPIHMLNLIRFRDQAEYSDARASTGVEAYQRYSDISAPVFQQFGGKIVWRGGYELTMVGPESEVWDMAFVAEYPSVKAFMEMMREPVYREAMVHRQAGVLNSRLVRFTAEDGGSTFAM